MIQYLLCYIVNIPTTNLASTLIRTWKYCCWSRCSWTWRSDQPWTHQGSKRSEWQHLSIPEIHSLMYLFIYSFSLLFSYSELSHMTIKQRGNLFIYSFIYYFSIIHSFIIWAQPYLCITQRGNAVRSLPRSPTNGRFWLYKSKWRGLGAISLNF